MSILLHGDCLEEMKGLDDNSIDLIFCDLPYNQTSCKWDQAVLDLDKFWIEVMRIKKLNTPIFFTTTTKFGVSLINSAPKKCYFRYDIVWVKSAPAGFLSAKKMPMRKHEMIYVFYEKLPFYDLSSHKHKFIDKEKPVNVKDSTYGTLDIKQPKTSGSRWDPALPVSVVKEEEKKVFKTECETAYGKATHHSYRDTVYDPPLPVSIVKEEPQPKDMKKSREPNIYGKINNETIQRYDPPLPVSVVKEDIRKDKHETAYGENIHHHNNQQRNGESIYDPPLPNSMLEIKSTRGKHSIVTGKQP